MPLIDLNGLGHFKDRENAMIAEDFSASKAYAAGDYCYYNGTLYKFKTAHAAGAWTIADVEAAKLAHDVSDLKESMHNLSPIENTESGNPCFFKDGSDDVAVKETTINILYTQGGSGQVSPSNPHPITGYNALSFIHGDNQYYNSNNVTLGYYINSNGDIIDSGGWFYTDFIPVETTIVYGGVGDVGVSPNSAWYDANKNLLTTFKQRTGIHSLTAPENAKYIRFSLIVSDRNKFFVTKGDIIERNFQQTIYGGSLNLTNGILKTEYLVATLSNLTFETLYTGNNKTALRARLAQNYSSLTATFDLSNFAAIQHPIIGAVSGAGVFDNPDEMQDGLYFYNNPYIAESNVFYYVGAIGTTPQGLLVYKIATPTTSQLETEEINTFYGTNLFAANSGGCTVKYIADTKLYIDNKIAELQATMLENIGG